MKKLLNNKKIKDWLKKKKLIWNNKLLLKLKKLVKIIFKV